MKHPHIIRRSLPPVEMSPLERALREAGLTPGQTNVAKLVAHGLKNKRVAERLFITEKSVKFHLTAVYKRLCIRGRHQLIFWCGPYMQFEKLTEAIDANPVPVGGEVFLSTGKANKIDI